MKLLKYVFSEIFLIPITVAYVMLFSYELSISTNFLPLLIICLFIVILNINLCFIV